jgi:hypothetical protein|tara:strand:+ start:147 stop:404 length:258 start_codon:yes stop_codon:yes gene_type:complete
MSTIIKTNSSNKIITINNNKYIPFQLHQLPKYYQEIELSSQFKLNGLIYININSLKNRFKTTKQLLENYNSRLTSNKSINYTQSR